MKKKAPSKKAWTGRKRKAAQGGKAQSKRRKTSNTGPKQRKQKPAKLEPIEEEQTSDEPDALEKGARVEIVEDTHKFYQEEGEFLGLTPRGRAMVQLDIHQTKRSFARKDIALLGSGNDGGSDDDFLVDDCDDPLEEDVEEDADSSGVECWESEEEEDAMSSGAESESVEWSESNNEPAEVDPEYKPRARSTRSRGSKVNYSEAANDAAFDEIVVANSDDEVRGPSTWNLHVSAFRKSHPDMPNSEVMKEAQKTYQAKKEEAKKEEAKTV